MNIEASLERIQSDITSIKVSQGKTEITLDNIKVQMKDGKKRFEKIETGCKTREDGCDKRFGELEGVKNKVVGAFILVPPTITAAGLWIKERWPF